jgi:hypothetical protein
MQAGFMVCTTCGGVRFDRSEYRTGEVNAPAFECIECHTLNLDESAANSDEERESVRQAKAARALVAAAIDELAPSSRPRPPS